MDELRTAFEHARARYRSAHAAMFQPGVSKGNRTEFDMASRALADASARLQAAEWGNVYERDRLIDSVRQYIAAVETYKAADEPAVSREDFDNVIAWIATNRAVELSAFFANPYVEQLIWEITWGGHVTGAKARVDTLAANLKLLRDYRNMATQLVSRFGETDPLVVEYNAIARERITSGDSRSERPGQQPPKDRGSAQPHHPPRSFGVQKPSMLIEKLQQLAVKAKQQADQQDSDIAQLQEQITGAITAISGNDTALQETVVRMSKMANEASPIVADRIAALRALLEKTLMPTVSAATQARQLLLGNVLATVSAEHPNIGVLRRLINGFLTKTAVENSDDSPETGCAIRLWNAALHPDRVQTGKRKTPGDDADRCPLQKVVDLRRTNHTALQAFTTAANTYVINSLSERAQAMMLEVLSRTPMSLDQQRSVPVAIICNAVREGVAVLPIYQDTESVVDAYNTALRSAVAEWQALDFGGGNEALQKDAILFADALYPDNRAYTGPPAFEGQWKLFQTLASLLLQWANCKYAVTNLLGAAAAKHVESQEQTGTWAQIPRDAVSPFTATKVVLDLVNGVLEPTFTLNAVAAIAAASKQLVKWLQKKRKRAGKFAYIVALVALASDCCAKSTLPLSTLGSARGIVEARMYAKKTATCGEAEVGRFKTDTVEMLRADVKAHVDEITARAGLRLEQRSLVENVLWHFLLIKPKPAAIPEHIAQQIEAGLAAYIQTRATAYIQTRTSSLHSNTDYS